MKKYIIITADTNDADYVSEKTEITDDDIELIKPIIEAIKNTPKDKNGWGHNYETGEAVDKASAQKLYGHLDNFDLFDEFVPSGDPNYPGVHTIKSIQILEVVNEITLL